MSDMELKENGMQDLSDDELDAVVGGTQYYYIQSGDTLTKIANKYKTTVSRLVACNNIENKNYIDTGKKIMIC